MTVPSEVAVRTTPHTPEHGASSPRDRPRRADARRGRTSFWPYLLVAPTVLLVGAVLGYPVVRNVVMSFQEFGLRELVQGAPAFVGLANYRELFADRVFWEVVVRTLAFTAVNVVLIMVLSTLVALLLARLGRVLRVAVMTGLVVVWAMPVIAATTVWQWLFQSRFGVVNWVLVQLGLEQFQDYSWLANGSATFALIVVLVVWQSVPFAALTLYAGLTTVPAELFEAARIDGAAGWALFRRITFPVLRSLFGLITSLEVIWVFKCFVQIWAISEGGPNDATTTLPVYAYQVAQTLNRYDLAGAVSVITVVVLTVLLLVYFRQSLRQETDR
ncbi:carbohydrate ABC transporter permease [Promicromonospora iranensis]|uniref:N,N'-diacetylchitobiose transport system permease protein n=1 Tax=Promicromonospora iranensis TaxID=1105144 RepID=A0ABU2CIB4_9MICO|nr:sugar ABC transporter permease [Promicromonospora iranensis]MDR7381081.1 N,N'-diacetylchitobiose transport system permease protein [Promicromonospora iranensis]